MTAEAWLASLFTEKHSTEWVSGLTGAGGAILGSVVTVVWTELFNRRTRQRDQKARNAAGSFAAFQRLNQIYSNAVEVKRHLDTSFAEAAQAKAGALCERVLPLNRLPGPVTFSVDELWTLTQVGGRDLINRVSSLDHAYNSLAEALDLYRDQRNAVWSTMTPERMEGPYGIVAMDDDIRKKLAPRFAELDGCLIQIKPIADELVSDTFMAFELLVRAKSRPLGKDFEIGLPDPEGNLVTLRATPKRRRWWAS